MPAVVRMPGVAARAEAFEVFANPRKRKAARVVEGRSLANAQVQYRGTEDTQQRYCLVVKDPQTQAIELVEVPLFDVAVYVPSERTARLEGAISQHGVENWQQRSRLGEAFGTKRAKTAIVDVTRNRIDADMLEGLEDAIVSNVKTRTANLQTDAKPADAASARPIPPFDESTDAVAQIYKIEDVVPAAELDALLPLAEELLASAEWQDKLPYGDSAFVNAQVAHVRGEETNVVPRLQLLAYISFLLAVHKHRRATSRQALAEKIPRAPRVLFDGVLERFATARPGKFGTTKERSFVLDPFSVDKLLCYTFVLMLHVNNFEVDVTPLAHELSAPVSRVESLFRNLGCVVRKATKEDAKLRELADRGYRIASLSAPLKLPSLVKRRRN